MEIQPEEIWNNKNLEKVSNFIKEDKNKQSLKRKIRNKYLSIKYRLQNLFK